MGMFWTAPFFHYELLRGPSEILPSARAIFGIGAIESRYFTSPWFDLEQATAPQIGSRGRAPPDAKNDATKTRNV